MWWNVGLFQKVGFGELKSGLPCPSAELGWFHKATNSSRSVQWKDNGPMLSKSSNA
ncbi:hypothetical protein A4A49_54591 [Nicotiana attenuata]|uniref:Uncharacterized protein n=1 Tax=Nicotiana attenuata TaxID=49451 RepID=A0A314LD52_NICAT|nr:hypothetical protein A4A49_54591 [Nicotiana attenuata]